MRKLTVLKYAVSSTLLALALTACSKAEKKEAEAEAEVKVAEPVVQEIQAVCDEPSLRNRLVDSLQSGLLDSALNAIQDYDDAKRLGLEQQVRQKLSDVKIDLQNVEASGATCHADVHFTLPAQDIAAANQAFEAAGLTALDEQAAEAGAALAGGNRLIAKDFSYTIEDNKAVIGSDNAVINLVANTLVAATHSMAGESRTNAENAPAVRLEPVAPIPAPRVQNREEAPTPPQVREREPQRESRPESKPQPRAERPESLPRPQAESTKPKAETAKPKAEAPKPKAENPKPKADSAKSETTRTVEKPKAETAKPKAEAPKAQAAKPVANDNAEITIVESNDTY